MENVRRGFWFLTETFYAGLHIHRASFKVNLTAAIKGGKVVCQHVI